MSTTKTLAQLPALTAVDSQQIRSQLDTLGSTAPLSAEEQQLIKSRVAAYRQNPEATVSLSVAITQIHQKLGL